MTYNPHLLIFFTDAVFFKRKFLHHGSAGFMSGYPVLNLKTRKFIQKSNLRILLFLIPYIGINFVLWTSIIIK